MLRRAALILANRMTNYLLFILASSAKEVPGLGRWFRRQAITLTWPNFNRRAYFPFLSHIAILSVFAQPPAIVVSLTCTLE